MAGLGQALDESPAPAYEWPALRRLLEVDALAALLGISPASVRRYANASRPTPDAIAERVHYLATLVGVLAGAYNEIGIRRWFERPRQALAGRSPAMVLRGEWSPQAEGPQRVRALAETLRSGGAT